MRRTVFLAAMSLMCVLSVSAQQHNIDTQKSTLTIHVGKTGVLSGLGHEHEVHAPIHSGTADTGSHPAVEIHVDARALRVISVERGHDPLGRDHPAGRALFEALVAPARALIPPPVALAGRAGSARRALNVAFRVPGGRSFLRRKAIDVASTFVLMVLVLAFPRGIAGVLDGREIIVSGLREFLAGLNVGLPVSRLAKWKTVVQMVAIPFLLYHGVLFGVITIAVVVTLGLLSTTISNTFLAAGMRFLCLGPSR